MSELKAFDVGLGRYTEDGYPCVVAVDADQNPRLLGDEKVYLKSEADKVIAELKSDIADLRDDKKLTDAILDAKAQRERHHKYKRCLAMAEKCRLEQERIELIENQDITDDDFYKLVKGFYKKWHKRWLEIAEKIKEGV